jgi:hypothetical protein
MTETKKQNNYMQLMNCILEYSKSSITEIAITEWYIIKHYVDEETTTCLCGKEGCKYVYTIKNFYNNNELFPIGSECMNYFTFDEEEKKILKIYQKWHLKLYNNSNSTHYKKPFNEVIKDVSYIYSLQKKIIYLSMEDQRLVEYANAVWKHNPPIIEECKKCIEQRIKGYNKCYNCYIKSKEK